jgi:hypothetical protein
MFFQVYINTPCIQKVKFEGANLIQIASLIQSSKDLFKSYLNMNLQVKFHIIMVFQSFVTPCQK